MRPRVLIVGYEGEQEGLRGVISAHSDAGWLDREIQFLPITEGTGSFVSQIESQISQKLPPQGEAGLVIFTANIRGSDRIGVEHSDLRRTHFFPSLDELNECIPAILRGVGLNWEEFINQKFSHGWNHHDITSAHISEWLTQFERLGSKKWIGERLLRNFVLLSPPTTLEYLGITAEELSSFDHVCCSRFKAGKSGDVLSNLLTKHIHSLDSNPREVEDILKILSTPEVEGKRILWVEDGLYSGTEIHNFFRDLLGLPLPLNRCRKVAPLPDPSILKKVRLTFVFSAICDLGELRLLQFLRDNDLEHFTIKSDSSYRFSVNTEKGRQALCDGTFFHPTISNYPEKATESIRPHIFQQISFRKKTAARRLQMANYCRRIGAQLFQNYLDGVGKPWPPEKVKLCGLGMHGIGLGFAFAHSVPKATLPIFWGSGPVTESGSTIDWIPLLPNGD